MVSHKRLSPVRLLLPLASAFSVIAGEIIPTRTSMADNIAAFPLKFILRTLFSLIQLLNGNIVFRVKSIQYGHESARNLVQQKPL